MAARLRGARAQVGVDDDAGGVDDRPGSRAVQDGDGFTDGFGHIYDGRGVGAVEHTWARACSNWRRTRETINSRPLALTSWARKSEATTRSTLGMRRSWVKVGVLLDDSDLDDSDLMVE